MNWVRLGLFSSFCSLAQSSTSGICGGRTGQEFKSDPEHPPRRIPTDRGRTDRGQPLYLDLIEEFGIEKSELIRNLVTAEVVERAGPVGTRQLLGDGFKSSVSYTDSFWCSQMFFFFFLQRVWSKW